MICPKPQNTIKLTGLKHGGGAAVEWMEILRAFEDLSVKIECMEILPMDGAMRKFNNPFKINPFKGMKRHEWALWVISLVVVIACNLLSGKTDPLTFVATSVGITALIFAARGNVWSPMLMIVFCVLYAVISYRFCYWGEMITYVGMSLPMAVWSTYTWIAHPSKDDGGEVAIARLTGRRLGGILLGTLAVTVAFYFILSALDTPNLFVSTISVTTSFLAASLTMMRSSYYALAYASNDIVLIVLWTLAALEDLAYLPVVANFTMFLVDDMYGFISWKRREARQRLADEAGM